MFFTQYFLTMQSKNVTETHFLETQLDAQTCDKSTSQISERVEREQNHGWYKTVE